MNKNFSDTKLSQKSYCFIFFQEGEKHILLKQYCSKKFSKKIKKVKQISFYDTDVDLNIDKKQFSIFTFDWMQIVFENNTNKKGNF